MGEDQYTYFVQFTDGKQQWAGLSTELEEFLYSSESNVHCLALGDDLSYYCRLEDGSSEWDGVPINLHNQLNGRRKSLSPPDEVTLGPNGEWFVRFENGDWQCGNHCDACYRAVDEIHNMGKEVVHMAFGHDDTWLITYE